MNCFKVEICNIASEINSMALKQPEKVHFGWSNSTLTKMVS